jgi:hypothetical protein
MASQPPPVQQGRGRAPAVRMVQVALVLLIVVVGIWLYRAGRADRQPGLVAPGSSSTASPAAWQPGEYQSTVAPCAAVSGNLLARLVHGAEADQDVTAGSPSRLCVWHVGQRTLIVRIQLHTPGGPPGNQTATALAGEDFAFARQGLGPGTRPVDRAGLARLSGLADEYFGVYDSSPPTYDVGRVVLHKRNALVDVQYQDSSRSPNRAALQRGAIAVAEDVIRHFR